MSKKIWLITGISSGFGQAIALEAITQGHFVIGTFRKQYEVDAFNAKINEKALGILVDVTNSEHLNMLFNTINEQFGRLDVLVNNAGIGFVGAVEEASIAETREVFEVNVFGALQVTQMALPIFRKQKSGHIFQISSGSGIKATAGFGIYNASKFALEGFSEALNDEIRPLGISLTLVVLGAFRTKFAGNSLKKAQKHISDYDATAGAFIQKITQIVNGNQEGNPQKGAKILMQIAQLENPPLRLPLGKIVLTNVEAKLQSVKNDMEKWREIAESSIF